MADDVADRRALPVRGDGDEIDAAPVLRAMSTTCAAACATGPMAAGFHMAVAELIADTADRLREETGIERVALSGGVFQNVLLLRLARAALEARDLRCSRTASSPPTTAAWRWARWPSPGGGGTADAAESGHDDGHGGTPHGAPDRDLSEDLARAR
jgi:hypothetical protein